MGGGGSDVCCVYKQSSPLHIVQLCHLDYYEKYIIFFLKTYCGFPCLTRENVGEGTHCTGKKGIMAKNIPSGKTQGIWKCCQNTGKTQGILIAQIVESLIQKVKDTAIFDAETFFRNWICLPSQFCVCNSHKSR